MILVVKVDKSDGDEVYKSIVSNSNIDSIQNIVVFSEYTDLKISRIKKVNYLSRKNYTNDQVLNYVRKRYTDDFIVFSNTDYLFNDSILEKCIEEYNKNNSSIIRNSHFYFFNKNQSPFIKNKLIKFTDIEFEDHIDQIKIVEDSKPIKNKLRLKDEQIKYITTERSTFNVSIIIPCYNQSKYIKEAVKSCISQTVSPSEILILLMDHDSISMKNEIENMSNDITCFISERLILSQARNFLIEKSKSDYVIPLDADDKLPYNFIEETSKIESDVVYVGSEYFGDFNGSWPPNNKEIINWDLLTTLRRNPLVCTALIKKNKLIEVGMYNSNMEAYEDMDLWIRMSHLNFSFKKCFNTKLLYRKVLNSNSLLRQTDSNTENIKRLHNLILNSDLYKRIPKIIHFVWLGDKPVPKEVSQWKNILGEEWEYKIWNENNIDLEESEFLKHSYNNKKYGICVDYIRMKVLHEYGGIWMDTDCIINNDIRPFLQYDFIAGYENEHFLNIGFLGSSPKLEVIKEILDFYKQIQVTEETFLDIKKFLDKIGTGPKVLTKYISNIIDLKDGFETTQVIDGKKYRIERASSFTLDDSKSGRKNYVVHLFDGSWLDNDIKWADSVRCSYNNWKIKNKI